MFPIGSGFPTTFGQGLLSGFGQPIVELHMLAAMLAVGALAATQAKPDLPLIAFVVASILGAAAHVGEATVANADVFAALTVVGLGLLLFRKNPLRRDLILAVFAAAGLLNGYWLGRIAAAADREPILGYFIGLALTESAVALAAMSGLRWLAPRAELHLLTTRVIGAFAVGAGAAILIQRYAPGA